MNNNHDPYTVAFIVTSAFLIITILLMRYEDKVIALHKHRMARVKRLHAQRQAGSRRRHPSSQQATR